MGVSAGPACPVCGEAGVPILYGLPTPAAMRAASAGRVRLAGCVITPDHDQWACPANHEWRTGDDAQLSAAISAAISD
ncbi:hypothetical protein GCM10029976_057700 [Kribbella albertanoniae]|uniref:Uncharacterized protein n=1 Tax=Kribbella albertanoniae TaxID=1266829 RepID=A0A4R4Q8F4_9ACTN|nr:hypothetical protein [Kribbella albertanoniae]TDC31508.1 hypothetical protein E1261_10545 [Kribbella albertanoniae]